MLDFLKPKMSKEQIAEILQTTPSLINKFEEAYGNASIDENTIVFDIKKMAKNKHKSEESIDLSELNTLVERVVDELMDGLLVFKYDGQRIEHQALCAKNQGVPTITRPELMRIPKELRPDLTGTMMKVDIGTPSSYELLRNWKIYKETQDEKKRKYAYNLFRQGLDILDLDPILYQMLGMNPNSMGNWLPQLIHGNDMVGFFKIPKTTIIKVPMPMLQLARCQYEQLSKTTMQILNQFCMRAFDLDVQKSYFVKTGTYSSKFFFRNAYVHGEQEVKDLGEYLLLIQYQANQMASPLNKPSIYGVSTTNEWVVREFIDDADKNPCIYHGLPLRTEYRVFVDFDTDEVLHIHPYWDPDTMKEDLDKKSMSSVDATHDWIVFKAHEDVIMERYDKNRKLIVNEIKKIIPYIDLPGQWAIDIMQNGNDFWLIDMSLAEQSFYYNCVPPELRAPRKEENWIPKLG